MADEKVTPQEFLSGKLRGNITDPNATARVAANLSTNWIYPDKPRLLVLSKNENNFPRISVTRMDTGTLQEIGMGGSETEDMAIFLVNVYAIKDRKPHSVKTTSAEEHTYVTGTDTYALTNTPVTSITEVTGFLSSVAHTFTTTDYQIKDNDSDGRFDSIKWSGGDTPDADSIFKVSYRRQLTGQALGEYLIQDVHIYFRDNWRSAIAPTLYDYMKGRTTFHEELDGRIQRVELQVKFKGINIGD